MVLCAEAGAMIMPAMPAFYQMPQTLDDLAIHGRKDPERVASSTNCIRRGRVERWAAYLTPGSRRVSRRNRGGSRRGRGGPRAEIAEFAEDAGTTGSAATAHTIAADPVVSAFSPRSQRSLREILCDLCERFFVISARDPLPSPREPVR
jgi:hypothetical protein